MGRFEKLRVREIRIQLYLSLFLLLEEPGSPSIGQLDIQATSLQVKWTAPADDGGSPITAYRVVIIKGGTEIKNKNVTDPSVKSLSVGDLEQTTEYTLKVFARNAVFEGPADKKAVKTENEGKEMCGIVLIIVSGCLSSGVEFSLNKNFRQAQKVSRFLADV